MIQSLTTLFSLALDLRALQSEFATGLETIVNDELSAAFGSSLSSSQHNILLRKVLNIMTATLDKTSTMDNIDRMNAVAASTTTIFVDFLSGPEFADASFTSSALSTISQFRSQVASRAVNLLDQLRRDYLSGARGPAPASSQLNKTRPVYEFIRKTLGIRMHGSENYARFVNGLGVEDVTLGQNISLIHEVGTISIRTHCHYHTDEIILGHPGWQDAAYRRVSFRLDVGFIY